ncbi:MAG TPA: ribosome recycling factor [Candidatus Saccharimonadales bacterium]|nr:ribosome recycling factor [Candidatus Saccharimonadales bacterium]
MMEGPAITKLNGGIGKAIAYFGEELKKIRTGRAHPAMLDGVSAEAYGQQMPLKQLATIAAPEPQLLQVTPFDANNLQSIADAIRNDQSLGLNPVDDGRVIRLPIPQLTEERRRQIAKQLGEKVEDCMIAIRGARHDAMKEIEQAKKEKSVSEDEFKRIAKTIDEKVAKAKEDIERTAKNKEAEILKV